MTLTKLISLVVVSLVVCNSISAQLITSPKKNQFFYQEREIDRGDMMQIMQDTPPAIVHLKHAGTNTAFAYVTAVGGGYFLGRAIGKSISGNYTDVLIDEIGIGTGLLILMFYFNGQRKKEIRRAVERYNTITQNGTSLRLDGTANGFGLVFSF